MGQSKSVKFLRQLSSVRSGAGTLCASLLALALLAESWAREAQAGGPTVEEYLAHVGETAKLVPAGKLMIDGQTVTCGRRPTVIDPTLDDYGAAYPGFLILNPTKIEGLPTVVKLWIFYHECAHQFRGPDETRADCFSIRKGRVQGWLNVAGMDKICKFIRPASGGSIWSSHYAGPKRCEIMRQCFKSKTIY